MIGVSILAFVLSMDGNIAAWDGALMFAGIIAYTIFAVRLGKASGDIGEGVDGSELVIGLTIVAVGNVVGSNIFNILAVLGLSAIVAPGGLPVSQAAINFDYPVMFAVAVACLPIFFVGYTIQRWEGAMFLGYYVAYTAFFILDATGHAALPEFSATMMGFVVPLTVITLFVVLSREIRRRCGLKPVA